MRRKLYRSRNGAIFGVCQGLAEHFELSVVWIRIALILLTPFTFPLTIVAYLVAALILKPQAIEAPRTVEYGNEAFYDSDLSSRSQSLQRLKARYDAVDKRIRRLEDYVTNKKYDWERRLNTGQ